MFFFQGQYDLVHDVETLFNLCKQPKADRQCVYNMSDVLYTAVLRASLAFQIYFKYLTYLLKSYVRSYMTTSTPTSFM